MSWTKPFSSLSKHDAPIAGGKGASLGEMTREGIPIPPGFVILSNAFEHFLEETDLNVEIDAILHTVDHKEMHTVEHASEKIQALIHAAEMPEDIQSDIKKYFDELDTKYVAVRSSATAEDSASAAWAGQLDSFLNTTADALLANVQKCWASLFTPRAIFYRFEKELHTQKISVAVVVQKMVDSECSGIAFSVHPVTEDRNQLIIEAGFGLGEAIVSGSVTPDSYVVEKYPRNILDINMNTQTRALYRGSGGGNEWRNISEEKASSQVLSEKQILELSDLIIRIENHYGFPCDIEWAYEKGDFYITQSRPITTLSEKKEARRLDLFGQRDFTLALLQIGLDAESIPLPHLDMHALERPYFVAEKKDGITNLYLDTAQVEWQKQEIFKRIESDEKYIPNILEKSESEYAKIESLLEKREALSDTQSLREFSESVRATWQLFTAWWWAAEILEEKSVYKDVLEKIMVIRRGTEKFVPAADHIIRVTIKKLYPDIIKYTEVISLEEALGDVTPSEEELQKRLSDYVMLDGRVYTKPDIERAKEEVKIKLAAPDTKGFDGDSFNGNTAYKGVRRGEVSIVLTKEDADNFEEGHILVASTTVPDFIHAIKKAQAIITDEGGIVSHAAIVSREMKIPCIIGTKIATQVLKDGDLVEVDADNGVVRVLEKRGAGANIKNEHASTRQKLEKVFSRDFSLIALQMDYLPESSLTRPWAEEGNPFSPYLIFWRNDGTSKIYFNRKGVDWVKSQLKKQVEKNQEFLRKVENEVRKGIAYIRPIYEEKRILNKEELVRFVDEFISAYHWIEAMWWIKSMVDDELRDIDCSNIVALRKETEELSVATDIVIRKSLASLYPKLGNLSAMISIEELRGVSDIDLEILKKRDAGFVLIDNSVVLDKSFHDVLDEKNLFVDEEIFDANTSVIKGEKVSHGKYKGIVVRVMGHNDFEKVKNGDIIVSPMTMADFLPVMEKAGAFITDEGGALCHAAIIARELQKPCVVGTNVATQLLRDGDTVEVDADNGIVRVLEKSGDSPIVMENMQSREHSLTYCYVWQIANQIQTREWFESVKNILFVNSGVHKKTRVWYGKKELENIYINTGIRAQNDVNFFRLVSKEFISLTDELVPYCSGQKKIESLEEWKWFYEKWIEWWAPMAIIFVLPESKTAPAFVREKALELRAATEKYSDSVDYIVMEYVRTQYPHYKDLVEFMTPDEILHIEKLTDAQINIIKSRRHGYIFFNGTLYAPNELSAVLGAHNLFLDHPSIQLSSEVKGVCASRGKVTGMAVVIYGKKDLSRITPGSILVTEMTSPDYVPYLAKVAAIVTDEGGINCHAAIVSREMNIPCIIGTKIVTHVIKDNDLIEVDADDGVVRILGKAK